MWFHDAIVGMTLESWTVAPTNTELNLQGLLAPYYTPGRRNLFCIITNVWTLREGPYRFLIHRWDCCHALTLSYKPKWWHYECLCLPCLFQQSSAVRELIGVSWLPTSSLGMRLAVSRSRWMQSQSAEIVMRKTWGIILKDEFTLPPWVAPPVAWLPLEAITNTMVTEVQTHPSLASLLNPIRPHNLLYGLHYSSVTHLFFGGILHFCCQWLLVSRDELFTLLKELYL